MNMPKKISVAEFLSRQIDASGLRQTEIAFQAGYSKPNFVTMLKQGRTKLPINKVPVFAKILGIDQLHLLRMVMKEYHPVIWEEAIEPIIGEKLVSQEELEILEIMRAQANGRPLAVVNEDEREDLRAIAEKIAGRNFARQSTKL